MTRYLLDTDTFSFYLRHHPGVLAAVVRHASDELALSVITVGELWGGWQAVIHRAKTPEQVGAAHDRLTDTLNELRDWPVVSFSAAAARRYADLKRQKLFTSEGDERMVQWYTQNGFKPVALKANDIATGLTTGLIEAAPSPASIAAVIQLYKALGGGWTPPEEPQE